MPEPNIAIVPLKILLKTSNFSKITNMGSVHLPNLRQSAAESIKNVDGE